jgi:hypothetical protein
MEVVTLVGGFRGIGLGTLTNNQTYALSVWLSQSIGDIDGLIARVRAATNAGQIATATAQVLEQQYDAVSARAGDLQAVTPDTDLSVWRPQATQVIADANVFKDQAHLALGDLANRGLKLTLLAVGSVALLGGAAWVIYRSGKRKHPGRRR